VDVRTSVPLAPLTTFHIGGPARYLIEAATEADLEAALSYAREQHLPLFILGAGSNVLIGDGGFNGMVIRMRMQDMHLEDDLLAADAGARWDDMVDAACTRSLYGIENLAGIPGTVGGAAVQNIGAYGAELAPCFAYADVIVSATGEKRRITRGEAHFAYRSSLFKEHPELVIVRIALLLSAHGEVNASYADLVRAKEAGVPLSTPAEVANAVRAIRAKKFPSADEGGTAGSFFKNPVVETAQAAALLERYPKLPAFPQKDGRVKLSLAWLLDHALSLKGHRIRSARLYEKQPLVIVADEGANASDVDALATDVATRVHDAFGIRIEREVEAIGA
jgi:UDP-N-acetylmuramate dehydrogenase